MGSTVTGNNKLFWVISLQNLDSSAGTLVRTYTQSRRAELTVKRLRLNRNWLLTGLFSSNQAVQIQLSVSLKKYVCVNLFWQKKSKKSMLTHLNLPRPACLQIDKNGSETLMKPWFDSPLGTFFLNLRPNFKRLVQKL